MCLVATTAFNEIGKHCGVKQDLSAETRSAAFGVTSGSRGTAESQRRLHAVLGPDLYLPPPDTSIFRVNHLSTKVIPAFSSTRVEAFVSGSVWAIIRRTAAEPLASSISFVAILVAYPRRSKLGYVK